MAESDPAKTRLAGPLATALVMPLCNDHVGMPQAFLCLQHINVVCTYLVVPHSANIDSSVLCFVLSISLYIGGDI